MNRGTAHRLQSFWDARAACNFIGGGSGSSLLVWAALGLLAGLPYVPAALLGLSLVAFGLLMVWFEIENRGGRSICSFARKPPG